MLAGCLVGWGILSPLAYYAGWAPGPIGDWKTGSKGWILWISLGVMVAESVMSLGIVFVRALAQTCVKGRNIKKSYKSVSVSEEDDRASRSSTEGEIEHEWMEADRLDDRPESDDNDAPEQQRVKAPVTVLGIAASTLLCICVVTYLFGTNVLPVGMTVLAVLVAMFLSVLAVRALGETDLNPVCYTEALCLAM